MRVSKHNRVIAISDVDCNVKAMIRDSIRQNAKSNLYSEFQKKHKDVALSLHHSVEEEYQTKEGNYSPEVIVPSRLRYCVC